LVENKKAVNFLQEKSFNPGNSSIIWLGEYHYYRFYERLYGNVTVPGRQGAYSNRL